MSRKKTQRIFFFVLIAGVFAYQLPESVDVAELFDVGNGCVSFLVQPVGEHGDKDLLGRAAGDTGQDRHHINVELDGCLVTAADFLQLTLALLAVQELGVEFDCLAHGGAGGHIQLTHEHGDVIRPVLLAEQLNVPQPVIFGVPIREWVVDEKIAGEVVVEQQLLDLKIVGAGEFDDLHAQQIQLVHHGLKFPLLVLPEDNTALIEFWQRGSKALL